MALPRNFPLASESELRDALKALNDAMMSGATPNSIGAGDFNVSLSQDTPASTVDRKLRQDLFLLNPTKYAGILKTTVQTVTFNPCFNL
jgi:hypothetical protein